MLKRKNKISPQFSMSSMTDIIFLLLIFFMITSTMVSPNAIYKEIVKVLNIANENQFKVVLATRRPDRK